MKPETLTLCTILISVIVLFNGVLSSHDPSDVVNSKNVTEIATLNFGQIETIQRDTTLINNDKSPSRFRRQVDTTSYGLVETTIINIFRYLYPPRIDARIGDSVFSCQQDDGTLVINRDASVTPQLVVGLFEWHPVEGIWWFIKCVEVNSRAGGYGLDMTNAQKPGGDSGLSSGVLKSLVGSTSATASIYLTPAALIAIVFIYCYTNKCYHF